MEPSSIHAGTQAATQEAPRVPSPARLAANRRNARRSTGPRTRSGKLRSALNALKRRKRVDWGRSFTGNLWNSIVELNEDPVEFGQVLRTLVKSHNPANGAEAMLVSEIASLRWQRRRIERAQAALLIRNLEKLEARQVRHALEIEFQPDSDARRSEVMDKGLLQLEDSLTKFHEILRWLDALDEMAENRDFASAPPALRGLYGRDPTLRGNQLVGMFEKLQRAGPNVSKSSMDFRLLRVTLAAERSDVIQQYELFVRERVEVTSAMRAECLVPADSRQWHVLLRHQALADRYIERKTRLLLELKRDRRQDERLAARAARLNRRKARSRSEGEKSAPEASGPSAENPEKNSFLGSVGL